MLEMESIAFSLGEVLHRVTSLFNSKPGERVWSWSLVPCRGYRTDCWAIHCDWARC